MPSVSMLSISLVRIRNLNALNLRTELILVSICTDHGDWGLLWGSLDERSRWKIFLLKYLLDEKNSSRCRLQTLIESLHTRLTAKHPAKPFDALLRLWTLYCYSNWTGLSAIQFRLVCSGREGEQFNEKTILWSELNNVDKLSHWCKTQQMEPKCDCVWGAALAGFSPTATPIETPVKSLH